MRKPLYQKLRVVAKAMNQRANKYRVEGRVNADQLLRITKDQKGRCFYCEEIVKFYDDNHDKEDAISFDHKVPMSRGGPNTPDNLVMCCVGCNRERNHQDQVRENGSKP